MKNSASILALVIAAVVVAFGCGDPDTEPTAAATTNVSVPEPVADEPVVDEGVAAEPAVEETATTAPAPEPEPDEPVAESAVSVDCTDYSKWRSLTVGLATVMADADDFDEFGTNVWALLGVAVELGVKGDSSWLAASEHADAVAATDIVEDWWSWDNTLDPDSEFDSVELLAGMEEGIAAFDEHTGCSPGSAYQIVEAKARAAGIVESGAGLDPAEWFAAALAKAFSSFPACTDLIDGQQVPDTFIDDFGDLDLTCETEDSEEPVIPFNLTLPWFCDHADREYSYSDYGWAYTDDRIFHLGDSTERCGW